MVFYFRCWSWAELTCVNSDFNACLILIKQKPCQIYQINISDIIIDSYSFCAIVSSSNVMNNIHQFCEIHFIILKFFLLLNITNFRNIRWNKSYFCNCRNTAFPGQIILLDKEPNPVSSYFDQWTVLQCRDHWPTLFWRLCGVPFYLDCLK